jgi:hypothetical protein
VPAYTAASVRGRLAPILAIQRCALVDGSVADTRDVSLTGLASAGAQEELRRAAAGIPGIGALNWHVATAETRDCPVLAALLPIGPGAGPGEPRLNVDLADGRNLLHDGERIRLRVSAPAFPAFVTVDYIASDGSVLHLYPQRADPGLKTTADPVVPLSPGQMLSLGDPSPGHPEWAAGEPYGTDMVIAVAASQPLFAAPRPGMMENESDYIRDLAAAVERARAAGVRLSANVRTVKVLEK